MYKKIALNIILLLTTYITPLYILYTSQDSILKMEKIQIPMLVLLFIGSLLITYLNNKYRRSVQNYKWLWVLFEIIGVIGLLYSGSILLLLYAFRNCCGF